MFDHTTSTSSSPFGQAWNENFYPIWNIFRLPCIYDAMLSKRFVAFFRLWTQNITSVLQQRSSGIGWAECSAKACTDTALIWIVERHITEIAMALSIHGNHHKEEVNNWIELKVIFGYIVRKFVNWMPHLLTHYENYHKIN